MESKQLARNSQAVKSTTVKPVLAQREKIGMRQVPESAKATLKARRRKVGETLLDVSI